MFVNKESTMIEDEIDEIKDRLWKLEDHRIDCSKNTLATKAEIERLSTRVTELESATWRLKRHED